MSFYNFKAPALPIPPIEYDQNQQNQFANALRLYFNRLDTAFLSLSGTSGGAALDFPYGSFYDTTTQTAAVINTAYPVTLDNTVVHNNIDLDPLDTSKVYVNLTGVYNFQAILQLNNNDLVNSGYVWVWSRVDGVDIPNSANKVEVAPPPADEALASINFVQQVNAGQYFQIMWATDNVNCTLAAEPATAFGPAIPSVILTVTFVSAPYA
jgi:hypothetical protein